MWRVDTDSSVVIHTDGKTSTEYRVSAAGSEYLNRQLHHNGRDASREKAIFLLLNSDWPINYLFLWSTPWAKPKISLLFSEALPGSAGLIGKLGLIGNLHANSKSKMLSRMIHGFLTWPWVFFTHKPWYMTAGMYLIAESNISGLKIGAGGYAQRLGLCAHHSHDKSESHRSLMSFLKFYSGTWPSHLTDVLSPRLVGLVEARIIVRSSYLQQLVTVAWIWTRVLTVANPGLFTTGLSHYPDVLVACITPSKWV